MLMKTEVESRVESCVREAKPDEDAIQNPVK